MGTRLPKICLIMGVGIILVASSLKFALGGRVAKPASLVAIEATQVWQSPNPDSPAAPEALKATFRLKNPGSGIVKVLETRSGCGCAQPKLRFDQLGPGEVGELDVVPNPIDLGVKSVPITLTTDSPVTPEVFLTLRLVGSRKPPYLQEARGDLTFHDSAIGTEASFDSTTVVPTGMTDPPSPIVRSTLPFLKIKLVDVKERSSPDKPGVLFLYRTYRAIIDSQPPEASFGGQVVVTDPWNANRFFIVHVNGSPVPALRAIPATVRLNAGGGAFRLTIVARDGVEAVRVEQQSDEADVLSIERAGGSGKYAVFAVSRRKGAAAVGEAAHLIVTLGDIRLVVPVQFDGGKP